MNNHLWGLMIAACLATYMWRGLGALLSSRINPDTAVFQWVRCVSFAMLAGLISRMTILPLSNLADTPLTDRVLSMGIAFVVFYLTKRQVLPGLLVGVTAFSLLTFWHL